jgi:hypothetical protein
LPLLKRKPALDTQYSTSDKDSDKNLEEIYHSPADGDADDMLADLDLSPADVAETDEEIIAALDAIDPRDYVATPGPVAPVADWLIDVRELARKHGPFSAAQTLQIIRELNGTGPEANR